jgi:hypothetical protein
MPPTLPSPAAAFVTRVASRVWGILAAALVCTAACHADPPPVAPGEPIPVAAEVALGTMDAECDGLIGALMTYKTCPNLDDTDRTAIDAWSERAQQDFAAGKKAKPDASAQRAIAAACHKASSSVAAATERCNAGPKPIP